MKEGDILGIPEISKVNTFLISIMMIAILLCCSSQVQAAQDGDYTYTVTAGKAQITKCTGVGGVVTIPSTLGGATVTSIGDWAFEGCTDITSISIPQGLTSIGEGAFGDCVGITSINIPQGVTSIGYGAFGNCKGLTSITVDVDNLNYASKDGMLYNKAGTTLISCHVGLTSISLPQGVTSIGEWAFNGCEGLTSISIPQGVTSIGYGAFYGCEGLTSITIQSGTTTIFDTEYTIPATTKIIGYDISTAKDYATKYHNTFEVIGATTTLAFTSSQNLPQAMLGTPFSYIFAATGGSGSGYTFSLPIPAGEPFNYPDGLSLNPNGVLSGTPIAVGTWGGIPVTVTDNTGSSVTGSFNLTVRVADNLDNWNLRNPLPQGNSLYSVTYGNNTFVEVGYGGAIVTSLDGITWTGQASVSTKEIDGITYGNNTFMAVGEGGMILTSPNGIIWTSRTSGTTNWLNGVAFCNNTFMAVGDSGTILTSPDGITWTSRTSGTTKQLWGVTYGNNIFVVVGVSGTILTSPDGISWTNRISDATIGLYGVTYGNNTFMAVGDSGTILTSQDGITWTSRTSGTTKQLWGVTYGNNTFVVVGVSGTILTSPDGISWTNRISGTTIGLYGVTYGNNTFVAVGGSGTILQSDTLTQSQLTITSTSLVFGTVGLPYNVTLTASGGTSPFTWSATGLPTGLNINTSTGVISGTPTAAGTSTCTVMVNDSLGDIASETYSAIIQLGTNYTATPIVQIGINPNDGDSAGIFIGLKDIRDTQGTSVPEAKLAGCQIEVDYDPAKVTIPDVVDETNLGQITKTIDSGKVTISYNSATGTTSFNKLIFKPITLKGSALDKTSLQVKYLSVSDTNHNQITVDNPADLVFQRGKILKEGSAQPDTSDAVAGLQYLAGLKNVGTDSDQVNLINMASIVGADTGIVKPNVKDIIALMQYLVQLRDPYFKPVIN